MVGTNAVKLRLPHSMWIHPVINISHLKPYKECLSGQSTVHSGPMEVTEDRNEEYKVEWIVDSHWKGRCLKYLVHWKGYLEEECTWEPAGNLIHAKEAITDFHQTMLQAGGFLDIKKDGFPFLPLMAAMCIFCAWKVLAFSIHSCNVVGMIDMKRIMVAICWLIPREK